MRIARIPGVRGRAAMLAAALACALVPAATAIAAEGDRPSFLLGLGHVLNGTFSLPQPLDGLGVVKTYAGPVGNDAANVTFTQEIGANDALRTGVYSKVAHLHAGDDEPVAIAARERPSAAARERFL